MKALNIYALARKANRSMGVKKTFHVQPLVLAGILAKSNVREGTQGERQGGGGVVLSGGKGGGVALYEITHALMQYAKCQNKKEYSYCVAFVFSTHFVFTLPFNCNIQ